MAHGLLVSLVAISLLCACTSQPVTAPPHTLTRAEFTSMPSTMDAAHDVLVDFLSLLNAGHFAEAAPLYGGEYEQLQVFNPEIDPGDHVALWEWVCQHQLLQCLEVRSAAFKELRGDTYIFQVEFSNPDGSLFVLGPCCGANETEMPPVSQFEFMVRRNAEHRYVVMTAPPYVP